MATGPEANESWISIAFDDFPQPDFADAVIVSIPATTHPIVEDPAWWARQVFNVKSAPRWVLALLGIRQAIVKLIGINKAKGDVFGIDRVREGEALIAEDDTHLDFRAAVRVDAEHRLLQITTVVRLKGWRGRIYWVPVSFLHAPVTRAMAKRAVRDFVSNP